MCGRFTLFATYADLLEYVEAEQAIPENEYTSHYNIAPSQQILAVINNGTKNRLGYLKWGLIPDWAKDDKQAAKLMNARAETVHEKPSFRESFLKRRCVIPMNGYYEWTEAYGEKSPIYVHPEDETLLLAAGIWSSWAAPSGEKVFTCSIITTDATSQITPVHHWMPVFLSKGEMHDWLNPNETSIEKLRTLITTDFVDTLEIFQVSKDVNSPKNDSAELIQRIEAS